MPDQLPIRYAQSLFVSELDRQRRRDPRQGEYVRGRTEDYVLLFTLPRRAEVPPELGAVRIGHVTETRGLWLRSADGEDQPLEPRGWDHLSVSG